MYARGTGQLVSKIRWLFDHLSGLCKLLRKSNPGTGTKSYLVNTCLAQLILVARTYEANLRLEVSMLELRERHQLSRLLSSPLARTSCYATIYSRSYWEGAELTPSPMYPEIPDVIQSIGSY